jgi:hypothetical protein
MFELLFYRSNPLLRIDQVGSWIRSNPLLWICIVVFVKSAPSNYKVVLATSRRSRLNQVKRHNPSAISHLYLYVRLVSHLHTLTQLSSAHILKEVEVAGGRRRESHAQSQSVFGVLVLVLALYWQSIIEEAFAGFSPP